MGKRKKYDYEMESERFHFTSLRSTCHLLAEHTIDLVEKYIFTQNLPSINLIIETDEHFFVTEDDGRVVKIVPLRFDEFLEELFSDTTCEISIRTSLAEKESIDSNYIYDSLDIDVNDGGEVQITVLFSRKRSESDLEIT